MSKRRLIEFWTLLAEGYQVRTEQQDRALLRAEGLIAGLRSENEGFFVALNLLRKEKVAAEIRADEATCQLQALRKATGQ